MLEALKMAGRDVMNLLLSDDLLINILNRVQHPVERQRCSLVCRRWLRLLSAACSTIRVLRAPVILSMLLRYPNLTALDCSACVQVTDLDVRSVVRKYGPQLQKLDLSNNKRITADSLQVMGELCSALKSLSLARVPLPDAALMAVAQCRNLQVLKLSKCRDITDIGLSCIAARCKNLVNLNLKWCVGITDIGIALLVGNCTRLCTLDLADTRVTSSGLRTVACLPSLSHLNLAQCNLLDDSALAALEGGSSSLKALDLTGCQYITELGIVKLTSRLTQLEQLTLSHCHQLADSVLSCLPKLPFLHVLKLERCCITNAGLTGACLASKALQEVCLKRCPVLDTGVTAMVAGCTGLLYLDLTCCQDISDKTLEVVAENCRSLKTLLLENCQGITSHGLALVAAACSNLQTLDCTDCAIDDGDVEAIAQFQDLRTLKLGFAVGVTDTGISHLKACCKALRYLDLYRCEQVGDVGLTTLLEGCQSLTEINLSYTAVTDEGLRAIGCCKDIVNAELRGCRGITSRGLAYLAKGLPHLTDLDLKHCGAVGDEGLLALAKGCSNLRQINLSYCPITSQGLDAMASLACMGNMKLVHCNNLSPVLMAQSFLRCEGLKKLKLVIDLRDKIPGEIIAVLESRGCVIRWMTKPEPVN